MQSPESTFRLAPDMAAFVAVVRWTPPPGFRPRARALLFLDTMTIDGHMLTAIADHDTVLMKLCP
ncbi:hypothetical protein [Nannocystis pusilla]|uniref:hypothetical protein n=1 Tax=Nannocystis pusilla TaxID=889268 RepID=UPI003BF1EF9E